jgi:hypothetical protein
VVVSPVRPAWPGRRDGWETRAWLRSKYRPAPYLYRDEEIVVDGSGRLAATATRHPAFQNEQPADSGFVSIDVSFDNVSVDDI